METLTSRERIRRIINREPADQVGIAEDFWDGTLERWNSYGFIKEGEDPVDHFDHDIVQRGWPNLMASPETANDVIEETKVWKVVRNSNGAHLKWWKNKDGTPEHIYFEVSDRKRWEERIRPQLLNPKLLRKRINVEDYRRSLIEAHKKEKYFFLNGINVFEAMLPMSGHEHTLLGMAMDPEWIRDMADVYSDLIIKCQNILIEEGGKPDGIWFYEDLGYKGTPFMSRDMYKDLLWPAHKKTFDYAHSKGLQVMVHSCGLVEDFIPDLIDAGMDCLQALEVKAGMDLVKLKKMYGHRIAFCGGMDARTLESNDKERIKAEIDKNLPAAMGNSGYILHTDHSVSPLVEYESYRYFMEYGLKKGKY